MVPQFTTTVAVCITITQPVAARVPTVDEAWTALMILDYDIKGGDAERQARAMSAAERIAIVARADAF